MAGLQILVVDDNPMFRVLATRTLENAGHTVRAVDPESPFAVLKACVEFQPDVVVLDYHMPKCNAETLSVILKRDPRFNAVKILGISTNRDPEIRATMLELGVDEFIPKGAMDMLAGTVAGL